MRSLILALTMLLAAQPLMALTPGTTFASSSEAATTLVQTLLNDATACTVGSTVDNCQYSGALDAASLFSGGLSSGMDIDDGILLTTGQAALASGPNFNGATGYSHRSAGDADLDTLASGSTQDAAVLSFEFIAQGDGLSFMYVFASDEYNEYVNASNNDLFAFFLTDVSAGGAATNIATLGGGAVSINGVNKSSNSGSFVNNDFRDFGGTAPHDIEYDGFTIGLTALSTLTAGNRYRLKLVIADVRDSTIDSAVFMKAGSFNTVPAQIQVQEVGGAVLSNGVSSIDFGSTFTGTPVQKSFTISNIAAAGAADLNLSNLTLPAGFQIVSGPSTIAAASSATLVIEMSAAAAGTYSGSVSATTSDLTQNPYSFNISGSVTDPAAQVQVLENGAGVAQVDFGSTTLNTAVTRTLTINNPGNAALQLSNLQVPNGFTVLNFPSSVAAQSSANFSLSLDANSVNSFSGNLSFDTNVAGSASVALALSGTVTQAVVVVPSNVYSVPTLSEWGMILLSLLLIGATAGSLRKQLS